MLRNDEVDATAPDADFKPLTAEQAQVLRRRLRSVSPWVVVAWQCALGAALALVCGLVTGRGAAAWSVAYGALAVVLPAALLARGLTGRMAAMHAGAAALSFVVWEFVKIALTVAMLLAAPRVVAGLSWPLLLLGLVVTLKVYWVALLWRRKQQD